MKNVLIIGARGTGRGLYFQLCENLKKEGYNIKGFLDDNNTILNNYEGYPPVISSVEEYEVQPNDLFICALGDPKSREKYVNIILQKGGEFITTINERAHIQPSSKIGVGVIIGPFVYIDADVTIGDYSIILSCSCIGHDTKIGNFCEIEPFSSVAGNVIIEDGAILHARSTIAPKIHVGENAVVGVGSVILKNIESDCTMFGYPARKLPHFKK